MNIIFLSNIYIFNYLDFSYNFLHLLFLNEKSLSSILSPYIFLTIIIFVINQEIQHHF